MVCFPFESNPKSGPLVLERLERVHQDLGS